MPEQLTKHPEVTLQVLRSAGAQCGTGAPQQILKSCPAERFCQLPGGELCVYGLGDASRMTQIGASDWQALAAVQPASAAASAPGPAAPAWSPAVAITAGAGLLLGIAIGRLWRRPR
jgi:hypothetical protein